MLLCPAPVGPGGMPALRDLGTRWAVSGGTVALRVPSAVVPGEQNFLLNPRHPDFARLELGGAEPFELGGAEPFDLDERLVEPG